MVYHVVIHYEGAYDFNIKAEDQEEAEEIAMDLFEDLTAQEIIDNMEDHFVCDCWERNIEI